MRERIVFTVVLAAIILIPFVAAQTTDSFTTQIADGARLRVTMLNQDPDPAEPGKYIELRWKVENTGSLPAKDVTFELLESYPFSMEPGVQSKQEIGTILGRQFDDEGVILYYKLIIDEDAVEGDNEIELKYKVGDNSRWVILDEFTIRIRTIDAALSIESVKTEPAVLIPGNEGKLKITLKNLADSLMQDITLKLDLAFTETDVATLATEDVWEKLPFAPVDSSTEKRMAKLKPGEEGVFTFKLASYPDAASRIYKIPVELTFYDELETRYTKNDIIGLVVGTRPDLITHIDSTTLKGSGTGEVSVRFVNKGLSDVKFLYAQLGESDAYDIVSARENYVGNVDSDDYETADFQLHLRNDYVRELTLPLHIEYMDSNNVEYSEDLDLPLIMYSAEELGEEKRSSAGLIGAVLIILVVGWFVYRRWEKKRKNKSR